MGRKRNFPTTCLYCHKDFLTWSWSIKAGYGKYCSHRCSTIAKKTGMAKREKSSGWKGGKYIARDGYVRVHIDKNRYALEHRQVMEKHIGRKLRRDEVIHHIDKDTTNNSIENLMVLNPTQHSQLHADLNRNGMWAKGHSCCGYCGKTDRKHDSLGLCEYCYPRYRKGLIAYIVHK